MARIVAICVLLYDGPEDGGFHEEVDVTRLHIEIFVVPIYI